MGFGRPPTRGRRPAPNRSGPPAWLVFLLGIALVFGIYYLWNGIANFLRSGGLPISQATDQAEVIDTATAVRQATQARAEARTPLPSSTPLPECQDFVVIVPSGVLREAPNTNSLPLDSISEGEIVCVLERAAPESVWYLLDANPVTRRIDEGFMREDIIRALNPTPTPSTTFTPAPTVTPAPTLTPTISPTPVPTDTPDPNASDTPTPTYTPSYTPAFQSL
jgi:hypothetical protein